MFFNLWHSLNIHSISRTFEVSKLDTSNSSSSLHLWNIEFILITLLVSNLFIPINLLSLKHSLNINSILRTFEVSKLDTSNSSNTLHF